MRFCTRVADTAGASAELGSLEEGLIQFCTRLSLHRISPFAGMSPVPPGHFIRKEQRGWFDGELRELYAPDAIHLHTFHYRKESEVHCVKKEWNGEVVCFASRGWFDAHRGMGFHTQLFHTSHYLGCIALFFLHLWWLPIHPKGPQV